MARSCRRTAMTIIEILVVVGIITVLVAILIPSLRLAREQVRSISCRSNMRQLATANFLYVADHKVLPATHSVLFFQLLFGGEPWPRISGVTWEGSRDRLVWLKYTPAYTEPLRFDPEYGEDVPGKGTLFRYAKDRQVYTCPTDKPGEALDTPLGGGGNGRLSYSMNAYIGYREPGGLQSFTYVADSLDNPLPGGERTRSFKAGQRVVLAPSDFMMLFEEHPYYHLNRDWPDGNFNGLDRISTRHSPEVGENGETARGRASIAFLDGHAEARLYPANTDGRRLFTEMGQPHFWRKSGGPDQVNMRQFIPRLSQPPPW